MKRIIILSIAFFVFIGCSLSVKKKIIGRWKKIKSIHEDGDVIIEEENVFYIFRDSLCLYIMPDREKTEDWEGRANRYEIDQKNGILKIKGKYFNAALESYEYKFNSSTELALSFYLLPDQKKRYVTAIYEKVEE